MQIKNQDLLYLIPISATFLHQIFNFNLVQIQVSDTLKNQFGILEVSVPAMPQAFFHQE